ncbi:MAG: hypothetical protein U0872_15315 [Planctomycetaceae bacterium]
MKTTEVDLSKFCDPEATRCATPFVRSGKKYATDGVIAVCVPADGETDTPRNDGRDFPNCKAVFENRFQDIADWQPMPPPKTLDDLRACRTCQGMGKVNPEDCPECDGRSFRTCDMGHDHDCDACDGTGEVGEKCSACKGKGRIDGAAYQAMGDQWVKIEYDQLLRDLPNVEWAFANSRNGDLHDCIQFRFEGGIGLLMVLNKDRLPLPAPGATP